MKYIKIIVDFILNPRVIALSAFILSLFNYNQNRKDKKGRVLILIEANLIDPRDQGVLPFLKIVIDVYYIGDTFTNISEIGFKYKNGKNNFIVCNNKFELSKENKKRSFIIPMEHFFDFLDADKVYLIDFLGKSAKRKISKKHKKLKEKYNTLLNECNLVKEANEYVKNK